MLSCTVPDDGTVQELLALNIPIIQAGSAAGSQFVSVTATNDWTITSDWGGNAWGELSQTSGSGSVKGIVFTWTANAAAENRSVIFTLKGSKSSVQAIFTQETKNASAVTDLKPDTPGAWMELPALNNPSCYFFTHDMTVGSYSGRNYSFYLDPAALVSIWVAYPLNKTLAGSGSRTDVWGLDPKVPEKYQPTLYSGFKKGSSTVSIDRGHQLPSADRLGAGVNETTFYGTNMTPQMSRFNQNIWATLEGMVRSWSYQFDTLYVVTGADLEGAVDYALDNRGKQVTIPVGYYKVLLGYKRNGTIGYTNSTGGYTGIAFYFEHRTDYTDNKTTIMTQAMTIDAIEEKLGMDFFVNLPSAIGVTFADKTESTYDPWWASN